MEEKSVEHHTIAKPQETHHEEHPHEGKKKNKALYVLIFLTVGLLVFSGVQTFQINGLEEKMITGGSAVSGKSAVSGTPKIPVAPPPRMVGGC